MERAVFRIIDANFNRAREALRLIEEFCRFSLNSEILMRQTKQLRHELSTMIKELDTAKLIASRDTTGDVGVGQTIANQLGRNELRDTFTAACKRLTEALRALAEMVQTLNPALAKRIENLRYQAYTLEKTIVLFSDTTEKFKNVRLYAIVTNHLPINIIKLTQQCAKGGADCIQLRLKDIEDDKLFALAEEFVKMCKEAGVLSIINDRVDIAVAASADGVHLGQNDLPIEQARKLQMAPLIIGKSTHSLDQLQRACQQSPTYVGLGPVFATSTKPGVNVVGIDYVSQAAKELSNTPISGIAIGGIDLENIERVLAAGAKTIAVCSAIVNTKDPLTACRKLKAKITNLSK